MLGSYVVRILIDSARSKGALSVLDVLCFHRVLAIHDPFRPDCPTAAQFRKRIGFYKKFACVLPLVDALHAVVNERKPGFFAAVTFDDGYKDNIEVASPILYEAGIRPTIFIASSFLNGSLMFNDIVDEAIRTTKLVELRVDELLPQPLSLATMDQRITAADLLNRKIKYLPPAERDRIADRIAQISGLQNCASLTMTETELKQAARSEIDLGGHSHSHPIATTVSEATFASDVQENKIFLENLTQKPLRCFAYPNGKITTDFLPVHEKIVSDAGYEYAFSTEKKLILPNANRFALPRFSPWGHNNWTAMRQIMGAVSDTSPSVGLDTERKVFRK